MTAPTQCPVNHGTIPVLDDDPFSPEILENPVPFQKRMREAGPVVFLSKYNVHAMGGYEDLSSAVANWQGLSSGSGVGLNEPWRARGLLQMDPPEHDAPREVLQEILSSRALRAMKDNCLERAGTLIDEILQGTASGQQIEIDGHGQIGSVFPVNFFPDASGIDETDRENLVPYADHIFNALGPTNDLVKKGECKAAEYQEWATAKCQRDSLKPVGFGADIWAAADRGEILHEHAPLLTRSLLSAGVDTTVYGISGMLYAFASQPGTVGCPAREPGPGPRRLRRVAALGIPGAADLPQDHRRGELRRKHHPRRKPCPVVLRRGKPRPAPLGEPGQVRPDARPLRAPVLRHGNAPVRGPACGPPAGRLPAGEADSAREEH